MTLITFFIGPSGLGLIAPSLISILLFIMSNSLKRATLEKGFWLYEYLMYSLSGTGDFQYKPFGDLILI